MPTAVTPAFVTSHDTVPGQGGCGCVGVCVCGGGDYYYSCDKKETKHDFDTAAYGVNRAEGHRWVFAAAERLAVPHSRPTAAAAATAAAAVTSEMSTQTLEEMAAGES